jgi:hypothetical protein
MVSSSNSPKEIFAPATRPLTPLIDPGRAAATLPQALHRQADHLVAAT